MAEQQGDLWSNASDQYGGQQVDARYSTFNEFGGHQLNLHMSNLTLNSRPNLGLDALPYAKGASWNPALVCLPGTRTELLEDILAWINLDPVDARTAEILCLSDVAGAGKSAIAHTISQRCYNDGLLGSAFFFDRNDPDRRHPRLLFSTIARDLARLNSSISDYICTALNETDPSLPSASPSRQFDELIAIPVNRYAIKGPVVIVIDALDEGYDLECLEILRDGIPKLPVTFRLVVMSRPNEDIAADLAASPHVHSRSIDIHGARNQEDIATYVRHRLRYIASRKRLGETWPNSQITTDFIVKSEGLFNWVATVSEYLSLVTTTYPERKLKKLLYERNVAGLPAEAKMDKLYAEILEAYDWSDEDFVADFRLLVGAIMAAKTPLSASALQALHQDHADLNVNESLRLLGSLLTGTTEEDTPIRILHLSFRDFLTSRAHSSPSFVRYAVDERERSQYLAFRCLILMNENLRTTTPGVDLLLLPLSEGASEVPPIPEALLYACRFWTEHVLDIVHPVEDTLLEAIRDFSRQHIQSWLEVIITHHRFQTLSGVRKWVQATFPNDTVIADAMSNYRYIVMLRLLSPRLANQNRVDEALEASQEAFELHRALRIADASFADPYMFDIFDQFSFQLGLLRRHAEALEKVEEALGLLRELAASSPEVFNVQLWRCLASHSRCLSNVGRRDDALIAIQEGVNRTEELSSETSPIQDFFIAHSLSRLADCLFAVGRREDALLASAKSLEIHRRLAIVDGSTFSNSGLAGALTDYAMFLSEIGDNKGGEETMREAVKILESASQEKPSRLLDHHTAVALTHFSKKIGDAGELREALLTVQRAVVLWRNLSKTTPEVYAIGLAGALNNESSWLSQLGHREEALTSIREAIDLYESLLDKDPLVIKPLLSTALSSLSSSLSGLGRRGEAVEAIQRSVKIRRELATDYPDSFNELLASGLNNLSFALADIGQQHAATEAIQESVDLYQRLAAKYPAVFNRGLATSLNNLSLRFSAAGDRGNAVKRSKDALKIHRELARDQPEASNADLANNLHNLASFLHYMEENDEALAAAQEAVDLYELLTKQYAEAFKPGLTVSLNTLSICLSRLGREEEALSTARKAVELRKDLATKYPAVFKHDLASSLDNLSLRLFNSGRFDEALEEIQEAVKLNEEMAMEHPAAFNEYLANSYHNSSHYLSKLGNPQEAAVFSRKAIQIYRGLITDRPAAFSESLANCLNSLSNYLAEFGQGEEALEAIKEAVERYTSLAEALPALFNAALSKTFKNLSLRLSDLHRHDEALAPILKSVEMRRELVTKDPAAYNSDLKLSLEILSACYTKLGQEEAALKVSNEAAKIGE